MYGTAVAVLGTGVAGAARAHALVPVGLAIVARARLAAATAAHAVPGEDVATGPVETLAERSGQVPRGGRPAGVR